MRPLQRALAPVVWVLFALSSVSGCGPRHSVIGPGATAELVVSNESSVNICFVFFTPTSDSSFGRDRLGANEVLYTGRTRSWSIPPDTWDYMLRDCAGHTLLDRRRIEIREHQRHVLVYQGETSASRTESLSEPLE